MTTQQRVGEEEPRTVGDGDPTATGRDSKGDVGGRFRKVGEVVVVVLKVATAAVTLYATIKGIGLVS